MYWNYYPRLFILKYTSFFRHISNIQYSLNTIADNIKFITNNIILVITNRIMNLLVTEMYNFKK